MTVELVEEKTEGVTTDGGEGWNFVQSSRRKCYRQGVKLSQEIESSYVCARHTWETSLQCSFFPAIFIHLPSVPLYKKPTLEGPESPAPKKSPISLPRSDVLEPRDV